MVLRNTIEFLKKWKLKERFLGKRDIKDFETTLIALIFVLAFSLSFLTLGKVGIWAHEDISHLSHMKKLGRLGYGSIYGCRCLNFPLLEIFGYNNLVLRISQSLFLSGGVVIS